MKVVASSVSALCVGLLLLMNSADAQQQIGNGVWVCDGAAQAGLCQADADGEGSPSEGDGYSDNDYLYATSGWEDRWGAISDDGQGVAGIVAGMTSKSEAEASALKECRSRGGGDCVVRLAYHNQCAAVAASVAKSFTQGAPSKRQAEKLALSRCNKSEDECWIYYSGCSFPAHAR